MNIVKYDELVRKLELKTISADIFDDKTVEFDKEFIEEVIKAMKEMRDKYTESETDRMQCAEWLKYECSKCDCNAEIVEPESK